MSETDAKMLAAAAQYAQAAADAASKLKPGTYEAVKAWPSPRSRSGCPRSPRPPDETGRLS